MSEPLNLYVIYDHPADYPEWFVVRRWENHIAKEIIGLFPTLGLARQAIPPGLHNLHRDPSDDKTIVEVWI